ncbi:sigma-70 family RNA polymerase sigma factor [Streptomyces purpurogeneiscleroticus]|uniref:sigma-70 family RNA polymerase sigma factor n=1 Tax=Streptomyces purpurogeneiscleroticus TaxID=68259 RepID=UPI001CBFAA94|nr:sigma-70 family RNA polymerase sigma factor [Streptomyces purpurogeneiscleroticus]MBZ4014459.1 RNA polymerase subunit sigma [Streptomyces purpurogeneiscleroticus]
MTLPEPSAHPAQPAPQRPGRKLGPIAENVGSAHRVWLEPVRTTYLSSGLTLNELSERTRFAKSKLSELLRGVGLYPRWEIVHSLATELKMPNWPLYQLWRRAAREAHKTRGWVEGCSEKITLTRTPEAPPMDHCAFRQTVEEDYRRYAQVFLADDQRDAAVSDTFDILWLRWKNDALTSPDTRRFAWQVLRAAVMAKSPHLDGRPDLARAAFDTVALQSQTTVTGHMNQLTESLEVFKAMSRLPDHRLDVMLLRRLCGFTLEEASALLGAPLVAVQSDERHAVRFLESVLCPSPETEGNTP